MILLHILGLLGATATVSAVCDACFNLKCYTKTSLFAGYTISGPLSIDRSSNILYFHFYNSNNVNFNAYFDLENINFSVIPNLGFTFARAVDQITHDSYMSGTTGVYKFNPQTNITEHIRLENRSLYWIQYKDKLYYAVYNQTGLYTFENGVSTSKLGLSSYKMDQFVVDRNNDIYFRTERAFSLVIYKWKNNDVTANVFADDNYALTTDKFGNAYLVQTASRGLYKVDYRSDTRQLIDVGAFSAGLPYSVVFDKDNNLIYHDLDTDQIFWLTRNQNDCRVVSSGSDKQLKKSVIPN